jgi:hypothetical protein
MPFPGQKQGLRSTAPASRISGSVFGPSHGTCTERHYLDEPSGPLNYDLARCERGPDREQFLGNRCGNFWPGRRPICMHAPDPVPCGTQRQRGLAFPPTPRRATATHGCHRRSATSTRATWATEHDLTVPANAVIAEEPPAFGPGSAGGHPGSRLQHVPLCPATAHERMHIARLKHRRSTLSHGHATGAGRVRVRLRGCR